jgi:ATP-binding protein involved in chromosome partitioning
MPPGTGDVHLSLAQGLEMAGTVLVTTPSPLALADAAKVTPVHSTLPP